MPTISLGAAVGTLAFALGTTTDLAEIDSAIQAVSNQRAVFGATQNRMEYAAQSIATYHENLVAAESRIRDVDMASEVREQDEAPDPAAGWNGRARAGQPEQAGRALAAAERVVLSAALAAPSPTLVVASFDDGLALRSGPSCVHTILTGSIRAFHFSRGAGGERTGRGAPTPRLPSPTGVSRVVSPAHASCARR